MPEITGYGTGAELRSMISKSAPAPEKKSVEPILKKTEAVTPPPKPTGGIIERPVVTSVDVKV